MNHCVNDILVQGALPLFFMDYIGTAKVDPVVFKSVIEGTCCGQRIGEPSWSHVPSQTRKGCPARGFDL